MYWNEDSVFSKLTEIILLMSLWGLYKEKNLSFA